MVTTRPKIDKRRKFEDDLLKLLQKYKMCKKGDLVQKIKIIVGVDKVPFIEIERFIK